jgi:nitrogen-specific signal transduction histidine kinase
MVNEVQKVSREREDMKAQVAIGQFTQMFAHDVRKPFNLMKMLFLSFEKNPSESNNNEMTKIIMGELDKNIIYVD